MFPAYKPPPPRPFPHLVHLLIVILYTHYNAVFYFSFQARHESMIKMLEVKVLWNSSLQ